MVPEVFGESERHGHASTAGASEEVHTGEWAGFKDGQRGVFGVDAVPAFGDGPGRESEYFLKFAENQIIDQCFVEGFDLIAVFV